MGGELPDEYHDSFKKVHEAGTNLLAIAVILVCAAVGFVYHGLGGALVGAFVGICLLQVVAPFLGLWPIPLFLGLGCLLVAVLLCLIFSVVTSLWDVGKP